MTEPDEALIWAKEQSAIRSGYFLHAYRAGQAASAERIKALEEEIDAARIEGIRLGLEAAAREAVNWAVMPANFDDAIRLLDPETIAKEADQ
jgi:hypothetical protein